MKIFYSLLAVLLFTSTGQIFAQGNFSSNVATGNWDVAGSWTLTSGTDADGVPDADDNVSILDGHTITITVDAACTSLTVGGGTDGTLFIGNNAGDDLAVSGDITINPGAIVRAATVGVGVLTLGGNLTNNGTLDLNNGTSDVNTTFNGTANQTVSGTGATTDFNTITVNNAGAANSNIVEITSTAFTVTGPFLTLTAGIFKISGSFSLWQTNTLLNNFTIPAGAGLWLNNANFRTLTQNSDVTLGGLLRITAGWYDLGSAINNSLVYTGSTSQVIVEGGILSIAGRFSRDGNNASSTNFTISAGTFQVGRVGSTSTTRAMFEISSGSSFTASGGTTGISLTTANPLYTSDYFNDATTHNVTGNGVIAGNNSTPVNQNFRISTTIPLPGLTMSTTNAPNCDLLTPITTPGSITIASGATLNTNNHNITLARSFSNSGTFNGGTSTVTFNGTLAQTFSGNSPSTFYNMVINNSSATGVNVTLSNKTITNNLTLTDGYVNISTGSITLTDNATVTGASDASFINGPIKKIGDDAFTFPVGKSGFYHSISISAPSGATDEFTAEYIRASATTLDADVVAPVKNVSACDYWTLDRNVGTSSVDVTLSWNANSSCNASQYVTNPATLTVAHYNGAEWDEAGTSGSFTGTATAGTVTRNAVSIFSPFSLGNTVVTDNPLPVRFGNLQGNIKNNGVQVDWDIYTEDNVNHYEVLRSADGVQFSNIGSVTARNTGQVGYGFFDVAPLTGMNYYRIRAIDKDGQFKYSIIVRVNLKKTTADITVYPNPVKDGNISFQSPVLAKGLYTVRLINSIAQEVYSKKLDHTGGSLSYSFQLPSNTKPGVYYLQLENENEKLQKKILIQ